MVAADRYQTATRPFAPANPCKISLFSPRQNPVAAYDPWDQMEREFFGDGSWGRGLSEFKTDIQDKGDFYLLEADLPGFKKEDIHVDVDGDTMTIRAERHSEH